MAPLECTSSRLLTAKLDERLRRNQEKVEQMQCEAKIVTAKYQTTKIYDEYHKSLEKQYNVLKAMEKLRERIARGNAEAQAKEEYKKKGLLVLSKKQEQSAKIAEQLASYQTKTTEVDRISEYLGFHVQLKGENVYTVRFTQLPIKEPGMQFVFDVHQDTQDKTLKVIRCEPSDCIDVRQLEDQINQSSKLNKFFALVLWTRKRLIDKYSN